MIKPRAWFVFDVESVGLHGEGFAVGWVVLDEHGVELESALHWTPDDNAVGTDDDRSWIRENVPPFPAERRLDSAEKVRERFWRSWMHWKERDAMMAADCPWPVEARFLIACVESDREARKWSGPYPLIDVASVRLAVGLDPLASNARLENELPDHDPLADARQSARLLFEALASAR